MAYRRIGSTPAGRPRDLKAMSTKASPCGNRHCYHGTSGGKPQYDYTPRAMTTPIRVLVAKPGLDGHDRGAKVIAKALRDAGMEVIYTGLRQTPEMIVNAALQEDVQVIGLSMLSGAHNSVVPRVMELLRQNDMTGVKVIVGGIIPGDDARDLERQGVAKVFQPGASLASIVASVREAVGPAAEHS